MDTWSRGTHTARDRDPSSRGPPPIMPNLTPHQKAERMLRFLLALRHPDVQASLAMRGFGDSDLEEGWSLLRALSPRHIDATSAEPVAKLRDVDPWATTWLPKLRIALAPFAKIDWGLSGRGPIGTRALMFFMAIGAVEKRDPELAEKVHALLARRGLAAALAEGRALFARATTEGFRATTGPRAEERNAAFETAVERMWEYYRQWSAIAREEIADKRSLQRMQGGHGKRRGRGA